MMSRPTRKTATRRPDPPSHRRWRNVLVALVGVCTYVASAPAADVSDEGISQGRGFDARDGASVYRATCQGCHMADGQGARGAGSYPALAGNPRVAITPYLVTTIVRGRNAMPAFGPMLDDAQIAAVASYVRARFAGVGADAVSANDVRRLR